MFHTLKKCLSSALIVAAPATTMALTIGVEDLAYFPYYETVNGEIKGFFNDFNNLISDPKASLKSMPVKRLKHALADGSVDAIFPHNPQWKLPQTKSKVVISKPIIAFEDGVVVSKSKLQGQPVRRISTVRGFTAYGVPSDIKIFEANDMSSAVKMMLTGRVDGVYGNFEVIKATGKKVGASVTDLAMAPELSSYKDFYHIASTNQELIDAVDKAIESDDAKKLLARYGF
jgi:ABC-type amino acid transport substrate-binding protein